MAQPGSVSRVCFAAALVTGVLTADAQWAVRRLHPAGSARSIAYGAFRDQQVGIADVGDQHHASMWNRTAASWVDLHPIGARNSSASRASGNQQVGNVALTGGYRHASLWNGTASSWVDLNPPGAIQSFAAGVSFGRQVGSAIFGSTMHAGMWNGTAGSWVDLNPAGAVESEATACFGNQQVGYIVIGDNQYHAGLWSGTAGSWVNLNPPVGVRSSSAAGISGGQQVGFIDVGSASERIDHAALWSGTAASCVDLNPVGAEFSYAVDISGQWQAGRARIDNVSHAGVWNGTADSWVDLNAFLPAGVFSSAWAEGVWSDGETTFVVGAGTNAQTHVTEALLWTIPAPCGVAVLGMGGLVLARRRR